MSALGSGCACPTAAIAFCPLCQRPALLWASPYCAPLPCTHAVLWPLGLYRVMRASRSAVTPSRRCLRWPHSAPPGRAFGGGGGQCRFDLKSRVEMTGCTENVLKSRMSDGGVQMPKNSRHAQSVNPNGPFAPVVCQCFFLCSSANPEFGTYRGADQGASFVFSCNRGPKPQQYSQVWLVLWILPALKTRAQCNSNNHLTGGSARPYILNTVDKRGSDAKLGFLGKPGVIVYCDAAKVLHKISEVVQ